jgi:aspartyl/asparaginyl beta-hydroxylase (cupin superfamily)
MAKQLERARASVEAAERWRKRLLDWQPDSRLTPAEDRRLRGFRSNLLENLEAGPLTAPMFLLPGLRGERYFEPAGFAGMKELEGATEGIREEFLAIVDGVNSAGGGKWSMIPLIRNGVVVEDHASRCPLTMNLARCLDLPRLGCISPSLYFSVLEPGSRIAPHSGITNARVIAHLPLIVPANCGFRVGGETREWQVGRMMVFDDMTTHEAWNDGSETRVVLIADLWRPELSSSEREGVEELMDCAGLASSS